MPSSACASPAPLPRTLSRSTRLIDPCRPQAFCHECWGGTLSVALERGKACIHDKCPQPGCAELVDGDTWLTTLPAATAAKLRQLALRSFVDANSLLSWCPNGACGRAAAHVHQSTPPELPCECGMRFCVLCGEPPHWPVSCARRRKWHELLHASPDAVMIMQLTRPCPSCNVRTQRSQGCMHITCTQCAAEWCWGCGQTGKKGEVHHVHECRRQPDPKWAYEMDDRKILDGSLAKHLDEWLYRHEQALAASPASLSP